VLALGPKRGAQASIAANVAKPEPLDLNELSIGCSALTPALGEAFAQAASVCLVAKHSPGVRLSETHHAARAPPDVQRLGARPR
jgi:hypothetical protein